MNKNNFKEENIKELLNIEANIAEKNISSSGLTVKAILFTIAGLIGMFLNLLSSHKFILQEVFLIFLLMFFVYIFASYTHGVIKILLEEKATALIFRKQFSHSLFRYNPIMLTMFLLFYIFIIISLSLTIPIYEWYCIGLYIFFIPLLINFILFLIFSYQQIKHPYLMILATKKTNKKVHIYMLSCFIFGIYSVCHMIFNRNFENPITSISYGFIIFAIVFLLGRLLVIYSNNNISQKISDIRIKILLGEIDSQKTARMLKFYIIGENHKDSTLNVLDDILNLITRQREYLNTTYTCLQNIVKEISEQNKFANKKILESINHSFSYYSNFINYFKKDLDENKKNINLLKEDAYSFNSNCVVDSPMTNIEILEEKYKEVENKYQEFLSEYKIGINFYEAALKLIIQTYDNENYKESDNLDILRQKSLIIANLIEK